MSKNKPLRILIADNDPRVRAALQLLLTAAVGPTLIRESGDLASLASQVSAFKPDLILLDWELPGRPAAGLLLVLSRPEMRPRVLVLSARPEAGPAVLAAGADAFVSKADPPDRLLAALRRLVFPDESGLSADWKAIEATLIARAWEDEEFRATLLNDPAVAVAQTGLALPEGVELKVVAAGASVEQAPGIHYLVLPARPAVDESDDFELSFEELDAVAGSGPRLLFTQPGFPDPNCR
ncbi:MAG: NHLP leader peptide family RiPP precursor [Ardenticatenaceae bacterium]|nr:NHLP leader peptide family RiPP precursor [Ardenticatenaceae bacterium]